ncbi:molecular chaperone DnaJ [Cryptosporangium phraense]|uniref:Molecular chaperone DnaJ n=1 Tax=Cryptosporangium phraense TaxID=2593070 RepID=A0A545AZL2_9ACTN|nr:molecular chaperone DnaJ [Cryptosporangium phraense]TQS46757.1 molecular chaperone DnaJ [Cryptosporangium phraense]
MCNPRRVRVRASRTIEDAWEQQVRRQVVRRGTATGEARVRESLDATLGGPTLAALAGVLGRIPGWEQDGDSFRHAVEGGYVAYHPQTREMEIVAQASADVQVTGDASEVVRGTVSETAEVEGVGTYYDDGWGGRRESDARRDAELDAERGLAARARELLDEARRQADLAEGARVEAEAGERADAALAEAARTRAEALSRAAEARLEAVGVQARSVFHRALAEAYRDAILAYARARRAEGLRLTEAGGVIEIEFEMPA